MSMTLGRRQHDTAIGRLPKKNRTYPFYTNKPVLDQMSSEMEEYVQELCSHSLLVRDKDSKWSLRGDGVRSMTIPPVRKDRAPVRAKELFKFCLRGA